MRGEFEPLSKKELLALPVIHEFQGIKIVLENSIEIVTYSHYEENLIRVSHIRTGKCKTPYSRLHYGYEDMSGFLPHRLYTLDPSNLYLDTISIGGLVFKKIGLELHEFGRIRNVILEDPKIYHIQISQIKIEPSGLNLQPFNNFEKMCHFPIKVSLTV